LDLNHFHTYPSTDVDPISRIVYSATRGDVETTIINGKVVMENRIIKTVDKSVVLKEANKSIKRLLNRLPKGNFTIR
jgi:cytosine/adenosine deaminase-related metal-dependent hydrolase